MKPSFKIKKTMDKNYWDNFYKNHAKDSNLSKHSSFALFCLDKSFIKENQNIVEIGCGNGRDAIFFARNKLNVHALDQSVSVIKENMNLIDERYQKYLNLREADFVTENYQEYKNINVFYSRFTIHSITKNEESILLPKIYNTLENDGVLCIEVRTTKDPLYGIGDKIDKNTYVNNNHTRRFIDSQEFLSESISIGFKLLYFTEENNLSVHNNDNPVLMRIVLQKG